MALFALGKLVITPRAERFCKEHKIDVLALVMRHVKGDWGDVSGTDKNRNKVAVGDGGRIFSAYRFEQGGRLWIITAAADDQGYRDHTTVMLPEDY